MRLDVGGGGIDDFGDGIIMARAMIIYFTGIMTVIVWYVPISDDECRICVIEYRRCVSLACWFHLSKVGKCRN